MTNVSTERLESNALRSLAGLAPFSAGDLIYATAADTFAKLPKGTASQTLMMNSGATAPEWADGGRVWLGTPITLSGISDDFLDIPSGVRRVNLNFVTVSTDGSSPVLVQLGTSIGVETSGYQGTLDFVTATATGIVNFPSAGFQLPSADLGASRTGRLVFELVNPATNLWSVAGGAGDEALLIAGKLNGYKGLAGTLDRVRILTENGTDVFDGGGVVNVSWEF